MAYSPVLVIFLTFVVVFPFVGYVLYAIVEEHLILPATLEYILRSLIQFWQIATGAFDVIMMFLFLFAGCDVAFKENGQFFVSAASGFSHLWENGLMLLTVAAVVINIGSIAVSWYQNRVDMDRLKDGAVEKAVQYSCAGVVAFFIVAVIFALANSLVQGIAATSS